MTTTEVLSSNKKHYPGLHKINNILPSNLPPQSQIIPEIMLDDFFFEPASPMSKYMHSLNTSVSASPNHLTWNRKNSLDISHIQNSPSNGHHLLQPIVKRPVAMGYSHDEMHMVKSDDPAQFDQVVNSEYTIEQFSFPMGGGGAPTYDSEMAYLQNSSTGDSFALSLNTPLYDPSFNGDKTDNEETASSNGDDAFSDTGTTSSNSPDFNKDVKSELVEHHAHAIKQKDITFVSASGKVKMICEVKDCTKVAQSRKRCKRHGGGPRCRFDGCTKSSQGKGRCRTHGGGKQCQVDGCVSGAQQRGFCSRHGGAKLCSRETCNRHSRGNGLCAHHGGGKRCSVHLCTRSSRIQGMCALHRRELNLSTSLDGEGDGDEDGSSPYYNNGSTTNSNLAVPTFFTMDDIYENEVLRDDSFNVTEFGI